MYLCKNAFIGNQKLQMYFYLRENNVKLEKIKRTIDFDYYILNKIKTNRYYDLSKKIDFKEFLSTKNTPSSDIWLTTYIEYINDLSIKNDYTNHVSFLNYKLIIPDINSLFILRMFVK